eukprot:Gb_39019 [translate_table: standard]
MDNLVSRCKDKLDLFRIKELKDVLSRIGIAKQGKKQALLHRIMAMLSDEQGSKLHGWGNKHVIGRDEVAQIIDDIYRKMHGSGAPNLASKSQNGPSLNAIVRTDVFEEPMVPESKTCCPCGSSMDCDTMIQCDERKCGVWQHLGCVIIPENPIDGVQPEVPSQFYCDICRINRGDPFWVTLAQPLLPTKLTTSTMTAEGSSPLQNVEKTFVLTRADRDLLQKPGYDIQVWCLLLNDKVPFRMHWPQYADLRVNGIAVRVTNRPGPQLLGVNGRDDGPGITACILEATNRISLSAYDARPFCLGVRIIRRRTVQQVLDLVPSQSEGERFEEALARVSRCIGGGTSLENADSDSDLEVVAESVTVNLRCPMSGSRIRIAGRFKPCVHMGCFDLETFVELNQRARKWQCPICLKNYSLDNIIIDPYFNRITSSMKSYPEDVTEVEVNPNGCWRPKLEGEARFIEQWHFPDGSICNTNGETRHQQLKQVKQEGISEGHTSLKLGMKRNRDGYWEVSGVKDMPSSSANNLSGKNEKMNLKIMPASSSATANNRDDEDPSVNQEGSDNLEFSANNDAGFDSSSLGCNNLSHTAVNLVSSQPPMESEVIVLSDSEELNGDDLFIGSSTASALAGSDTFGRALSATLNSPEGLQDPAPIDCNGIPFIPPSSAPLLGSFPEVMPLPHAASPQLGLFGGNNGEFSEFSLSHWSTRPQNAAFRLFGADADISDTTTNAQHASVVRPTPVNRYGLAPDQQENPLVGSMIPNYPLNAEGNGDLNENSLGVGTVDVPLQFFLPPQPARASFPVDCREPVIESDDMQTDWISLSLGTGGNSAKTGFQEPMAAACGDRQQSTHKGDRLDSLANTASVLLNMSNNRTEVASVDNQESESPFSHHQRPRSVRPRFYLPVDSDSE